MTFKQYSINTSTSTNSMWRKSVLGSVSWRESLVKSCQCTSRRYLTTKSHGSFRILFCGSDEFSIASLRALHEYAQTPSSNIISIDVAAKKDKPTGRGLKVLKSPLITSVAAELGLRLHQFNTFSGWNPPTYLPHHQPYINLIIAVSFGLLVPPRILNSAKYGGINVHPSLLPQLRGAAPLEWTIINGDKQTGVSVQTLHPSKFDEGTVILQTPQIDVPKDITLEALRDKLAPIGAEMLVDVVQKSLFVEPKSVGDNGKPSLAPKITTETKELQWRVDDLATILRKNRAIPKLWVTAQQQVRIKQSTSGNATMKDPWRIEYRPVRILLSERLRAEKPGDIPKGIRKDIVELAEPGTPFAIKPKGSEAFQGADPIFLLIKDEILVIPDLHVAGQIQKPASNAAAGAKLMREAFELMDFDIYMFHEPLHG